MAQLFPYNPDLGSISDPIVGSNVDPDWADGVTANFRALGNLGNQWETEVNPLIEAADGTPLLHLGTSSFRKVQKTGRIVRYVIYLRFDVQNAAFDPGEGQYRLRLPYPVDGIQLLDCHIRMSSSVYLGMMELSGDWAYMNYHYPDVALSASGSVKLAPVTKDGPRVGGWLGTQNYIRAYGEYITTDPS